ncbi:MAG: nitrogenase iron-molybdenum cofactor biosynthesis protein NifE [Magnetospirillum sp.]|nr:nitrogenase iron-molybdenum cofactor biosynthesis protein NifE [Magnetospirillum sp.]
MTTTSCTKANNGGCASKVNNGGCAFRGAKMALQPIVDAAHLVHGPVTCQGLSWDVRPTASSGPRLHRDTLVTDLGEMDIIHGGEERLAAAVEAVIAAREPAGVLVYQTCVPALIGDDVKAVCQRLTARFGRPILAVDVPGFTGGRDTGSNAAGDVLLDQLIGTREPERRTATDIVLIGEYNVAGEVWQAARLLSEMGIRVLASIPGDGRMGAIATAHRARAAIALCSQAMGGLAAKLEARYGIPFVQGSFYGMGNIATILRGIAALLATQGGPADLPARAEAMIARHQTMTQARLRPLRPLLTGKLALLLTGGVKTWSLADALREMGMAVAATTLRKSSTDDRRRAAAPAGRRALVGQRR